MASNLTLLNTQVANLFSVIGGAPLLCMLGSRLLIGMKEAGARDVNFASGASSTLMQEIAQGYVSRSVVMCASHHQYGTLQDFQLVS